MVFFLTRCQIIVIIITIVTMENRLRQTRSINPVSLSTSICTVVLTQFFWGWIERAERQEDHANEKGGTNYCKSHRNRCAFGFEHHFQEGSRLQSTIAIQI